MGLLDDAIREHLDLKRRRGADPAEIERDERDALGPVRRNRDASAVAEADALIEPREAAPGSARDEPDDGVAADLVDEHPTLGGEGGSAPVGAEALVEDDPFADEDDPFGDEAEPSAGEEQPFDDDDAPATRIMRAADVPAPADRTAEYDVEETFAEDQPPAAPSRTGDEDEDVLEETPDFLQDTPDHDRLWFEQRPPRDFDFDG